MKTFCKQYRPWAVTSRGEICNACVDNERRTIKKCYYVMNAEDCPQYEPRKEEVSNG